MRFNDALFAVAGAGGAPAWTPAMLPSLVLWAPAYAGLTHSGDGTAITACVDQAPSPHTITVNGSPIYNAADPDFNGQPSVTHSVSNHFTASAFDKASKAFFAGVFRVTSAADCVFVDGLLLDANRGAIARQNSDGKLVGVPGGAVGSALSVGTTYRIQMPLDGSTQCRVNGANIGTLSQSVTGTGIRIGSAFSGVANLHKKGDFIICSSVPSSGDMDALDAYWSGLYVP